MAEDAQLLQSFHDAYRAGPAELGHALERSRSKLTAEVANQALEQYRTAIQQNAPERAIAAATIASRVFNFIGRREDAFNAIVDYFGVLFMLADTEKAYADVYTALRQLLAGDPYGEGAPTTALRALTLAADCGFFACEAAAADAAKKHWLQAALDALQDGAKYLADARSPELIAGFVSTAVNSYGRCLNNGWAREDWAEARLAALTSSLDRDVPGKVIYPGDEAKTRNVDAARGQMSATYDRGAYAAEKVPGQKPSGLLGRKVSG